MSHSLEEAVQAIFRVRSARYLGLDPARPDNKPSIIGRRADYIFMDDLEDRSMQDDLYANSFTLASSSGLSSITDKLNRLGENDPPIPADLSDEIRFEIEEERFTKNKHAAVELVKSGLYELKRRKQEIKDKARELKRLKSELRTEKDAFITAANAWGER